MNNNSGPNHKPEPAEGVPQLRISDVVDELCQGLTVKLVASLCGVGSVDLVSKWVRDDLKPSQRAEHRLRFAHSALRKIEACKSLRVAQAWFMSPNPRLGGSSPLGAIRDDRFDDTAAAARALMEDGYDG